MFSVRVCTVVSSLIATITMPTSTWQLHGGFTFQWCVFALVIAFLVFSTVLGNIGVLVALFRARRAPAHYPLASLAAADLLLGLAVLPVAAVRELFVVRLHWLICLCWETVDVLCCTASICSLCALGWERWCGITAPLARVKRAYQARLFAGLVWPVSMGVAIPTAFVYTPKLHPEDIQKACGENVNTSYVFVSSMVSFYVPASVMLVLYARILYALSVPPQIRAHHGRTHGPRLSPVGKVAATTMRCSTPLSNGNPQDIPKTPVLLTPKRSTLNLPTDSKHVHCSSPTTKQNIGEAKIPIINKEEGIITRQRRATRTIVRLMAMFLVCWTPFFVMTPIDSMCDCVPETLWQCFTWLGYTNSALNPIMYAAASPSVRRALHASLTSSARPADIQMTPNRRA